MTKMGKTPIKPPWNFVFWIFPIEIDLSRKFVSNFDISDFDYNLLCSLPE